MKKLLILLVFIQMAGCKKENNSPSPNANNPPTITSTETALLGHWYIQKVEYRNSSNVLVSTDTSGHYYGDNVIYQADVAPNPGFRKCVVTQIGNQSTMDWKASGDIITPFSGVDNKILLLTASDLVYTNPIDTTSGGIRYYYHK